MAALPLTPNYIALRYNITRYRGATMMSKSKERHSRLGWVELHILLALGNADLHGYAIMQKVSHDTNGRIRLGAGTLYGAIKRLTAARLIAVAPQRKTADQRRVCYRILAAGREAIREELQHTAEVVRIARSLGMPVTA
jgi:DNA-binding PadR family transcriptional regulator